MEERNRLLQLLIDRATSYEAGWHSSWEPITQEDPAVILQPDATNGSTPEAGGDLSTPPEVLDSL